MLPVIKSELRKLFTVRSTYLVSVLAIALCVLFSWVNVQNITYMRNELEYQAETEMLIQEQEAIPEPVSQEGVSEEGAIAAETELDDYLSKRLREAVTNAFVNMALLLVIIAILHIVHEYRHNTIVYTLTTSNSRTKVFVGKMVALLLSTSAIGLIGAVVGAVAHLIFVNSYGLDLPPQDIAWGGVILRGLLYVCSFVSLGAIIAWVSRNVALAVAATLIVPTTVEPLLSLLIKEKAIYLPFSAMQQIVLFNPHNPPASLGFAQAASITLMYLAVLYLIAWFLFLRRDAN